MDTGTIITTIILMAACILPFIFMNIKRKKKEKMLLSSLRAGAASQGANIWNYDIWGNAAIGFDEKTNQAFFYKLIKDTEVLQHIGLADVKKSNVLVRKIATGAKDDQYKMPETIALTFTFEDSNKSEVQFELYNAAHDGFVLKGEIQIAEKWSSLLNGKAESLKMEVI